MNSIKTYKRSFGLDIIRVISISVVLIVHGYFGFFTATGLSNWQGIPKALSTSGVFALEFLFVLSGFLIGTMMIRSFEKNTNWWHCARDFWLRRWFRTIPGYYLFIILNLLLIKYGFAQGQYSNSFLIFSQNLYSQQAKPYFFSESWSLALDEWFYFLAPILLGLSPLFFLKERRTQFLSMAIILIIIPMIIRLFYPPSTDFLQWDDKVRRVTILHLDSTGWGVLAAIISRWYPKYWSNNIKLTAIIGLLLTFASISTMFYLVFNGWQSILGGRLNDFLLMTMPALAAALLLPWLSIIKLNTSKISKVLGLIFERLSDYSYAMYLCHTPLIFLMSFYIKKNNIDIASSVYYWFTIWIALVILSSAIIFHLFEKPIFKIREKFTSRVQAGVFDKDENKN